MYYYSILISEITEYIKISSDRKAVKVNSEMWAPVMFSFCGSHPMTFDSLRKAERLFFPPDPILSQFSVALEEDILLRSGCTL